MWSSMFEGALAGFTVAAVYGGYCLGYWRAEQRAEQRVNRRSGQAYARGYHAGTWACVGLLARSPDAGVRAAALGIQESINFRPPPLDYNLTARERNGITTP